MKIHEGWSYPDADVFMANEMKADGTYQASHYRKALEFVADRSLAIDGGAHVGTWSRLMNADFERVIAVEPHPETCDALTRNMRRFECSHVEIVQAALGAKPGFVSMAPLDARAEALKNTGAYFVQDGGSIPRVTVDDWQLPSCGFLKLDMEGSEVDAIQGAALTLQRCRPIVLWECKGFWRRFGHQRDAPHVLLMSLDYYEMAVVGCDRIWGPRP
jgi:FkbM family methyltransferase